MIEINCVSGEISTLPSQPQQPLSSLPIRAIGSGNGAENGDNISDSVPGYSISGIILKLFTNCSNLSN